MTRGSTPTHIFNFPIATSLIKQIRITYAQGDKVILTKTEADCVLEDKKAILKLTQQETLSFDHTILVEIQVKALTVNGDVLISKIENKSVDRVLDDEVLQ